MKEIPVIHFILGVIRTIGNTIGNNRYKTPKILSTLLIGASVIFLTACGTATLSITDDTVETNEAGLALIEGKVNNQAELTIDGSIIPTDKGRFSYDVQLTEDIAQKIILTTQYKNEKQSKTVTIKPSQAFVKHLTKEEKRLASEAKEQAEKEKRAKEIAAAEAAVVMAETTPVQENYDKAFTLVQSLTSEKSDFEKRLEKVKQTIQLATEKAEKTKEAETALAVAESQPTKNHYEAAKLAIAAVPGETGNLATRLDNVNATILAAEQEVARQAQAEAQISSLAETGGTQEGSGIMEMVYVTATGAKYHARKCGNGTYTQASMEQALSKGLEPCSKCF